MFNLFRSQKQAVRLFLGGLLLLVAASMVITLIPGLFSSASNLSDPVLAEVGDRVVTIQEVQARLRDYARAGQLPPDSMSFMAAQIVENLINEKVLLDEAERLGLTPNEEEVAESLRTQLPFLFPDGVFVGNDAYSGFIRQRFQLSIPEFEENFRRSLILDSRLKRLVTDNVFLSDEELEKIYRRQHEQSKIEYVTVDPAGFQSKVEPTEEQVKEYFEKNKARYRVQEKRSVKMITIDSKALPEPEITAAEIERFYNQNRTRFETPEQIRASHILFMTTDKSEEEIAEIEKKAQQVLKELKEGGDFAALAKKYSEDPGTADKGGDLGWVTRGQMVDNFERASFALKAGEISDLVKTEYGFHIITVHERQNAHQKPLEEVREEIRQDLIAERQQLDRMRVIDEALAVVRKFGRDMEAAGQQLGIPVETYDNISRVAPPPQVTQWPDLLAAVFSAAEGEVVTSGQDEKTVVAVITAVTPPRDAEFAEVADRVRRDFITEQTRELAKQRAEEIAKKAREADGNLRQVASQYGLKTETSEFFDRSGAVKDVGPASLLGETAFGPPGTIGGPVGGRYAVFRVVAHQEADMSQFEAQREELRERELGTRQTEIFEIYKALTRRRYEQEGKITKHQDRVDNFIDLLSRRG